MERDKSSPAHITNRKNRLAGRCAESFKACTRGPSDASIDDCHALDFDQNAGMGEVRDCNKRATRKFPVWKKSLANFDELIAVTGIADEDCHRDEVGK